MYCQKLQEISIERIEVAIETLKNTKPRFMHVYQYPIAKKEDDSACESVSYTLPDLYRELARRIEDGTTVIRDALREFEDQ